MSRLVGLFDLRRLPLLLRGESGAVVGWVRGEVGVWVLFQVVMIAAGAGLYGAAVGCWRDPLQSLFLAIKLPLILLLTALANGLANGMLAPLLGLNITFRQSLLLVLMSFTIAAAVLGAFSPIIFFLIWNTPAPGESGSNYFFTLLTNVLLIAFAGIIANLRLLGLIQELSGSRVIARKVVFAWLAGNLLLGAQISWNLRPFIGSPDLAVEFIRANAFEGNFYETVYRVVQQILMSIL